MVAGVYGAILRNRDSLIGVCSEVLGVLRTLLLLLEPILHRHIQACGIVALSGGHSSAAALIAAGGGVGKGGAGGAHGQDGGVVQGYAAVLQGLRHFSRAHQRDSLLRTGCIGQLVAVAAQRGAGGAGDGHLEQGGDALNVGGQAGKAGAASPGVAGLQIFLAVILRGGDLLGNAGHGGGVLHADGRSAVDGDAPGVDVAPVLVCALADPALRGALGHRDRMVFGLRGQLIACGGGGLGQVVGARLVQSGGGGDGEDAAGRFEGHGGLPIGSQHRAVGIAALGIQGKDSLVRGNGLLADAVNLGQGDAVGVGVVAAAGLLAVIDGEYAAGHAVSRHLPRPLVGVVGILARDLHQGPVARCAADGDGPGAGAAELIAVGGRGLGQGVGTGGEICEADLSVVSGGNVAPGLKGLARFRDFRCRQGKGRALDGGRGARLVLLDGEAAAARVGGGRPGVGQVIACARIAGPDAQHLADLWVGTGLCLVAVHLKGTVAAHLRAGDAGHPVVVHSRLPDGVGNERAVLGVRGQVIEAVRPVVRAGDGGGVHGIGTAVVHGHGDARGQDVAAAAPALASRHGDGLAGVLVDKGHLIAAAGDGHVLGVVCNRVPAAVGNGQVVGGLFCVALGDGIGLAHGQPVHRPGVGGLSRNAGICRSCIAGGQNLVAHCDLEVSGQLRALHSLLYRQGRLAVGNGADGLAAVLHGDGPVVFPAVQSMVAVPAICAALSRPRHLYGIDRVGGGISGGRGGLLHVVDAVGGDVLAGTGLNDNTAVRAGGKGLASGVLTSRIVVQSEDRAGQRRVARSGLGNARRTAHIPVAFVLAVGNGQRTVVEAGQGGVGSVLSQQPLEPIQQAAGGRSGLRIAHHQLVDHVVGGVTGGRGGLLQIVDAHRQAHNLDGLVAAHAGQRIGGAAGGAVGRISIGVAALDKVDTLLVCVPHPEGRPVQEHAAVLAVHLVQIEAGSLGNLAPDGIQVVVRIHQDGVVFIVWICRGLSIGVFIPAEEHIPVAGKVCKVRVVLDVSISIDTVDGIAHCISGHAIILEVIQDAHLPRGIPLAVDNAVYMPARAAVVFVPRFYHIPRHGLVL